MADGGSGDAADHEVQSVFTSVGVILPTAGGGMAGGGRYTIVDVVQDKTSPSSLLGLQDRSDDEESDHGTPDPYTQQSKGRVSPSPYTANTERARQFNAYVRSLIEQKLDVLIPISHQPRDLVQTIIADASVKFPEFASCVRKRIRTFLKSYRRSKRVKDLQAAASVALGNSQQQQGVVGSLPSGGPNGVTVSTGGLSQVEMSCQESVIPPQPPPPLLSSTDISHTVPLSNPSSRRTAVVTITTEHTPHAPGGEEEEEEDEDVVEERPSAKKPRLSIPQHPLVPQSPVVSNSTLTNPELSAVRQLIIGYRESAAFLSRAADQLEQVLAKEGASNSV